MKRQIILLCLAFASCSTAPEQQARFIPYDGYGSDAPRVGATYAINRPSGMVDIEVEDINGALDEFLSPAGDHLILLPNRLNRTKLDYSLESLAVIDAWLLDIHALNRLQTDGEAAGEALLSDGRGDNTVLFAGLYLGEVIRSNSTLDWQWQRFDRFIAANPYFIEHYGVEAGFDTFVLVGPQGVTTPANAAVKRILLGREESLEFIGTLLVEPVDLESATSGVDLYGLDQIR